MKKLISSYIIAPWAPAIIMGVYALLNAPDLETVFFVILGGAFIGYVFLIFFGIPLIFLCLKIKVTNWYHLSIAGALSAAIPITLVAVYFPIGRGEAATTLNNLIVYLPLGLFFGAIAGFSYWYLGIYTNSEFGKYNK